MNILAKDSESINILRNILENGTDPNEDNNLGLTHLHIAATHNNHELAKRLLDYRADPDEKDNSEFTPLHYAATMGHQIIVRLLLDYRADPDAKDNSGSTPLHYAATMGHHIIVGLLLDRRADPDAKDNSGTTPLHYAATMGHHIIVGPLLDHRADLDAKDNSGSTPLHYAATMGHHKIVELLLDRRADPDAKDNSESTPLHYVATMGYHIIVELLLDRWADPDAKDKYGSTPLHNAVRGDSPTVVKLLFDHGASREALDNSKLKPQCYVTSELIARQFLDLSIPMEVVYPRHTMPIYPITINGNTCDPSTLNALETNYILVQSWTSLSPSEWQDLEGAGLKDFEYVSNNTYLCHSGGSKLDDIRQLEPVIYADVYSPEFKIAPDLKNASKDEPYTVDITFHNGVSLNAKTLRDLIAQSSHESADKIKIHPIVARLTMKGEHLSNVALLDFVRSIEIVGETVMDYKIA
ncbi:hypothetical protein QQS21_000340 [Conoideocrella luteorostrata]|uniref:Ankyrin repeat protein n=1 Tax=Conoideocrella luteorostrata TaxID=1105319 RepID=A0AAJ0CZB6_9HYPO|nr:hypothetical protein QQS21_000340 [Conoideocrella luteorostrata]